MRALFLNSWFGEAGKRYYDFIKNKSEDVDIFCLTEVSSEVFERLTSALEGYIGIYERGVLLKPWGIIDGIAIFLKKGLKPQSRRKLVVYRNNSSDTGFTQYVLVTDELGNKLHLLNVHGKTRPGHKLDTRARLEQSRRIIEFFGSKKGPKVIGGDFNLMPQTKSIKMFEKAGYVNLIKKYNIKSTRNKISWEQFKGKPGFTKQYFADYVFVSAEVKVKNFEVPYTEVSDHLPLVLEFEL